MCNKEMLVLSSHSHLQTKISQQSQESKDPRQQFFV